MNEKTTDEVPIESFTISTRDYNDLMLMLAESRNRMMRVAQEGSRAAEWCKNISQHIDELEKKYK
jgi:hypothetical protein|tara:strand:+ start:492 stop:686 length:195 start_codon:yes stop_codon:yes gene_type:complete